MSAPSFIAVDWGTTHARFWLIGAGDAVIDARTATGIAALTGGTDAIAAAFDAATDGWPADAPAMLCGMVGSSIGWRDAGYLPCPAPIGSIGRDATGWQHGARAIAILPGLHCQRGDGADDVMRGEETQIAGLVHRCGLERGLIALPGTHNKWVALNQRTVTRFHTAMTGELFALIADHSILMRGAPRDVMMGDAFLRGVYRLRDNAGTGIEAMLFGARAAQLVGGLAATDAASFISGMLIGADVRSAIAIHAPDPAEPVHLVCAAALATLYAAALSAFSYRSVAHDGGDCVQAGLIAAARAAGF